MPFRKGKPRRAAAREASPRRAVLALRAIEVCLLGFACATCSLTVDADRNQCSTDADCTARGPSFVGSLCASAVCQPDPKWACLQAPLANSTATGPFHVTMHFDDLVKRSALPGLNVDLCRKVDVSCAEPVSTTLSDTSGGVDLLVEPAFTGYVSVHGQEIVPVLYFFNPAIDRDQDIPALQLSNAAARGALLGQLQANTDRADVLLHVVDCTGKPAAGITFSVAPEEGSIIHYYLASGLPTRSSEATDASGYGGFVNLPSGTVTVTATDNQTKAVLDSLTLVVRAGAATWTALVPHGD